MGTYRVQLQRLAVTLCRFSRNRSDILSCSSYRSQCRSLQVSCLLSALKWRKTSTVLSTVCCSRIAKLHDNPLSFGMADASRDRMISKLKEGYAATCQGNVDMSHKRMLVRGCDPKMAERAKTFLPAMLGNVQMTTATSDDTFLQLIRDTDEHKWDVVVFAPGAMRWDSRGEPIPGGNTETQGWTLHRYKQEVETHLGADVPIVGTADEKEMVPMLRKALGMQ